MNMNMIVEQMSECLSLTNARADLQGVLQNVELLEMNRKFFGVEPNGKQCIEDPYSSKLICFLGFC